MLCADSNTYIQYCAQINAAGNHEPPCMYILEYQEGSLDKHYRATEALTPERVQTAFLKYLCGDLSWRSDFRWERMSREDLSHEQSELNSTFMRPHRRSSTAKPRRKVSIVVLIGGLFIFSAAINAISSAIHSHEPLPDAVLEVVGTVFLWAIACLLIWAIITGGWWRLLLPIGLIALYILLLFAWPLYTLLGSILIVLLDIRRRR